MVVAALIAPGMVRVKSRYVLFEILFPLDRATDDYGDYEELLTRLHKTSPLTFTAKQLARQIKQLVQDHYGDYGGGSCSNLQVKYFSNKTSTGIVKVAREHFEMVVAALALIDRLDSIPVIVRCLHVLGTVRKCQEWVMERNLAVVSSVNLSLALLDRKLAQLAG